jgi:DNA-binding transcriptional MerR regulator
VTKPPDPGPPEGFVDRREFLKRVNIDSRTLTRWISEGIVNPRPFRRGKDHIHLFSEDDVLLGRQIKTLHLQNPGRFRLSDLAAIARGKKPFPEHGHDPAEHVPPWPT